ncbi:MAG: heavy metal translocating P-type ATPase [Sphaerochaetaceae bacterium]|jgi:Cu+-exporting ATPase
MKKEYDISGMTCSACVLHVEKGVKKVAGLENIQVNLLTNTLSVEAPEGMKDIDLQIIQAVEDAGYEASSKSKDPLASSSTISNPKDHIAKELKSMKKRVIISFAFSIPLVYLAMGHMFNWPLPPWFDIPSLAMNFAFSQFLLAIPVFIVNGRYFSSGFKALYKRAPTMDSLIALGSTAALVYGVYAIYQIGIGLGVGDIQRVHRFSMDLYFESAVMILSLVLLGKYFELRAKGRTSDAISKLIDLSPKTATIIVDGVEKEIAVEQVQLGDLIVVRPGGRFAVDGTVVEGHSAVDESALTGESLPVDKHKGDQVFSATINTTGRLVYRADKVGDDTTLAHIIKLVEEASASKAPISKLADRISSVFVPIVIVIALVSTLVWLIAGAPLESALAFGIAVLVISCPCALGLATPTAIMVGTGKGAEHGILIRSAESLETAQSITAVVLDKTGTITEGKPEVTDMYPLTDVSESDLLFMAASLEQSSEHPLSIAILERAQSQNLSLETVENFYSVPGKGLQATLNKEELLGGNSLFMRENDIDISQAEKQTLEYAKMGKTPLYFAQGGKLLGVIAVADVVKPSSGDAINTMKDRGLEVVMLTGDNEQTARAIAQSVNIDRVFASVLPDGKESVVRSLQDEGHVVAMVGDGINDAPALVRADIGLAIGAGTDIAIESADIILMRSDLRDVPSAIALSRATLRNIKQNLFWALFYNTLGIPLAAGIFFPFFGWRLNPMFAAAAMSLSSIFVVTNALRLKRFGISHSTPTQKEHMNTPTIEQIQDGVKGENEMKKVIHIEGMSCGHCVKAVEKALATVEGLDAHVDLENNTATVNVVSSVSDEQLTTLISDAGYSVTSITQLGA